jgi:hypothetical protein
MLFTALHRVLGRAPGPLTEDMIDAIIAEGVTETDDLDFKRQLPPAKGIPGTDFPKDVAAMANRGGGVLVYGVDEKDKAAIGRTSPGALDEGHERALRAAAVSAISPPVFGLGVHRIGDGPEQVVVVVVPDSVDGPHLIYRGELFGAPVRNDADTHWMREREIESMYRARFEQRRHSSQSLDALYAETAAGRGRSTRAWLVAVAHPRTPRLGGRIDREQARDVFVGAEKAAMAIAGAGWIHPLEHVDRVNPRPGLRRWVAATEPPAHDSAGAFAVHADGSVSLGCFIGAARVAQEQFHDDSTVLAGDLEVAVGDFMGVLRTTAAALGQGEYDVRVGIEWDRTVPLRVLGFDQWRVVNDSAVSVNTFTPVATTLDARAPADAFHEEVRQLVLDCINQCGLTRLRAIR